MNMRNADIRSVTQWMSEVSGKHFLIDPNVEGNITVVSPATLSTKNAYAVFLQALRLAGYSTQTNGNVVSIVPDSKRSLQLLESFDSSQSAERAVHVIPLQQISAAELVEQLQPLVPDSAHISALPGSNSVMIADQVGNIQRLRELSLQLDRAGNSEIDIVKLRYATAADAVRTLQNLQQDNGAATPYTLASDTRSNSVLINADAQRRQQLKELLQKIDKPLTQSGQTKVVYIHYLQAEELVPLLRGMHKSNTDNDSNISVQASKASNALVLTAPPPQLAAMEKVIREVDIRRSQVLVEAIIVEVNDDLADDIGVEWQSNPAADGSFAGTEFGLNGTVTDGAVTGLGSGFSLGYVRNGSLRALATAMETDTDANLLSTPSIVTQENQEASILVGRNIPVRTGEQTGQFNDTNNPFTTIERRDIGLKLKITPTIDDATALSIKIEQSVENLSETVLASGVVIDKREISTKVTVEDDEILVLGGLIRENDQKTTRRVPVLGHIPVLGRLFQREETTVVRNNLMVFIRPKVLKRRDQRNALSKEHYETLQNKQRQLNEESELPSEKPLLPGYDNLPNP
jgi:general secretion pathway protein D